MIARLVVLVLALAACSSVEAHYSRTVSGSVELAPWGTLACLETVPISDAIGWRCLDGEGDFTCAASSCQVDIDPDGVSVGVDGTHRSETTRVLRHGQAIHVWPRLRIRIGAVAHARFNPHQENSHGQHP